MGPGGLIPHSQGLFNLVPRPCVIFLNKYGFYSVSLLASRQTLKLEDHSWSAVHDCLFNIFDANLNITIYHRVTQATLKCLLLPDSPVL